MSWSKIQRLGVVLYWDWSWIRWLFESFPWENIPNISWERVYSVFLGGSWYLFRREDFCMLKAKAHWKRTQETYPWLGYVQQFDLQKVFVFCYGSYVSPKNHMESENTLGKEKHGHKPSILSNFLGCKAQLLVFFSSIEPNWGTSFAQLHCSQGAGEILGVSPEGGWDDYFPKAIVGLVQCYEVYADW